MYNGYTSLNMTKLDVMSDLDELKIGINYMINGKKIDYMPPTVEELAKVEVEYITLPGWKSNISGITRYSQLPQKAKDYINAVESLVKIPITWVGTGPERESIAIKE